MPKKARNAGHTHNAGHAQPLPPQTDANLRLTGVKRERSFEGIAPQLYQILVEEVNRATLAEQMDLIDCISSKRTWEGLDESLKEIFRSVNYRMVMELRH